MHAGQPIEARCSCTEYGYCAVCRPILPAPTRPRLMPELQQLPIFSSLFDNPRFGLAVARMSDEMELGPADAAIGLYAFFTELETGIV